MVDSGISQGLQHRASGVLLKAFRVESSFWHLIFGC